MYAKLINGALEYAPTNYKLSDGRVIVGFNKNVALMTRYGYKEVIDNEPEYDNLKEYLIITGYTEQETTITVIYAVKQMDRIEEVLTTEDKINQLRQVDTEHELAIAEIMEILLGGMR